MPSVWTFFRNLDNGHMVFLHCLFAEIDQLQAGQSPLDDCTAVVVDFDKRFVEKEPL